jgi:hypothetical protein
MCFSLKLYKKINLQYDKVQHRTLKNTFGNNTNQLRITGPFLAVPWRAEVYFTSVINGDRQ